MSDLGLTLLCRAEEEYELELAREDLESLIIAQEEFLQKDVERSLLRSQILLEVGHSYRKINHCNDLL